MLFALGAVPTEALHANLGARVLAFSKPNNGVRPIACGSVVRRLAARAMCSLCADPIAAGVGPRQFGVGTPAGCEVIHKCVTALTDANPDFMVTAFDALNAFNSLPRRHIWQGVLSRAPCLANTALVNFQAKWELSTVRHITKPIIYYLGHLETTSENGLVHKPIDTVSVFAL